MNDEIYNDEKRRGGEMVVEGRINEIIFWRGRKMSYMEENNNYGVGIGSETGLIRAINNLLI